METMGVEIAMNSKNKWSYSKKECFKKIENKLKCLQQNHLLPSSDLVADTSDLSACNVALTHI